MQLKDYLYYEEEGIQLYKGDCNIILPLLRKESIDLCLTDPPYGINYLSNHYKYGNPHQKIENDDKLFVPLNKMWNLIKSSGSIFIFYSQKVPLIDNRIKNVIVWIKNNWTAGDLRGDFGNQYELIAFMPKENFKLQSKRYSNVWYFDRIKPIFHPTQKPKTIIKRIINCASKESSLILDCFAGSGTTLIACKEMNRKVIGIEINEKYCEITANRLKNTISGKNNLEKFL